MGRSLYESAQPRPDVLSGVLNDTVFAASLDDVVAGTAPPQYQDPRLFFAATHPSGGLRSLLAEVFGRLSGARPDAAPVIRLETNLGGGKTHNLVAAYHVARGALAGPGAPGGAAPGGAAPGGAAPGGAAPGGAAPGGAGATGSATSGLLDPSLLPAEPVRVGVLVGTGTGATSFPDRHGVRPRTVWGDLALSLGGADAYAQVAADDAALTAPGAAALGRVLGDGPALILVDELAAYLAKAGGVPVGSTTLATQTTAFLMSLIEAVTAKARAVLVLTSTQIRDAFGEQTESALEALAAAMSLVARKEHVLRPSEEADLPAILRRRLFESVDPGAPAEVASSYVEAVARALKAGTELPDTLGPGFAAQVEASYPFHPDVVAVLDKRLSTIPNFQRTRGALRLLARTVRHLWLERPPAELVHLHHIDLAERDSAEDLSSRLDRPALEPVIRADIAGQKGGDPSHAEVVDDRMAIGAPYARRLATTIYLWSLTRDVPGVPAGTAIGSVLEPGDDANVVARALEELERSAWYLSVDSRGYRFSTEASLPKLVQEAESLVLPGRVKTEATEILATKFRDSVLTVRRSWTDAKVPDRSDAAWLVVLHWDEFGATRGVGDASGAPAQVLELWEKKPDGGLREFRNRLAFLVPSAATHEPMLRAVRRKLALDDLRASGETLRGLAEGKRLQLDQQVKEASLEATIAVCNHVNVLYYPARGGLEGIELDTVSTGGVRQNQTEAVVEKLRGLEKLLAHGDPAVDPAMIAARLGEQLRRPVPTAELLRTFARRTDLRMVLDQAQVANLVLAGVRNGVWEYQDPERGDAGWATEEDPAAAVRIAEDTFLHPLGSAPSLEEEVVELPLPPPRPVAGGFRGVGKADVAIVEARQQAADAGRQLVRSMRVSIEEVGTATGVELAKLLSVLPQGTPGAQVRYQLEAEVDLGRDGDQASVRFVGTASSYAPLKAAVDQLLRSHEAVLRAAVVSEFAPPVPVSGDEVEATRRRAADTGPAMCTVNLLTEEHE